MKLADIEKNQWNVYVGLLTIEQKDLIHGKMYADDSYFNELQDANDNWIISVEEMMYCTNPDFMWVQELPLIEYVSKHHNLII